jgi:hypothetical protein
MFEIPQQIESDAVIYRISVIMAPNSMHAEFHYKLTRQPIFPKNLSIARLELCKTRLKTSPSESVVLHPALKNETTHGQEAFDLGVEFSLQKCFAPC